MKNKIENIWKKSRLLFFCIVIMFTACKKQPEVYLETYTQIATEEPITERTTEENRLLYVYVCGAVLHPDVYALADGSRICDAIAVAGGLREDADTMSVNQAQLITDGQMLRIYTIEEALSVKDDTELTEEDGRININTATKSELMTLPGIGVAKAEAILTYRTEQGAFGSIEDLKKIPGIKEGIFEQLKERIKIN